MLRSSVGPGCPGSPCLQRTRRIKNRSPFTCPRDSNKVQCSPEFRSLFMCCPPSAGASIMKVPVRRDMLERRKKKHRHIHISDMHQKRRLIGGKTRLLIAFPTPSCNRMPPGQSMIIIVSSSVLRVYGPKNTTESQRCNHARVKKNLKHKRVIDRVRRRPQTLVIDPKI